MNKQTLLALLMATIAILTFALACGSSDTPTDTPGQGVTNQTLTPPTDTSADTSTNNPSTTADQSTPLPTVSVTTDPSATQPWPTPLPTRTLAPTSRLFQQPESTEPPQPPSNPSPDTTPTAPPKEPTPPPSQVLPAYDGSSPLIHIYVEEPYIFFEREVGASVTLPIKGLTQDGQHVSIENPTAWGITFEPYKDTWHQFDENGVYTILEEFETVVATNLLQFQLRDQTFFANVLHITKDRIQTPTPGPICSVDYATSGRFNRSLRWFFIFYTDRNAVPAIEQAARLTGAKTHGEFYYDEKLDLRKHKERANVPLHRWYPPLLAVELSPDTCPTIQESLQALAQIVRTPGAVGIRTIRPDGETIGFIQNPALH